MKLAFKQPIYEGGDDEQTPLGDKDKIKKFESDAFQSFVDDNFTLCEGLTMIFKQSLWPIIGMLFHPTYMLVNAKILGSID